MEHDHEDHEHDGIVLSYADAKDAWRRKTAKAADIQALVAAAYKSKLDKAQLVILLALASQVSRQGLVEMDRQTLNEVSRTGEKQRQRALKQLIEQRILFAWVTNTRAGQTVPIYGVRKPADWGSQDPFHVWEAPEANAGPDLKAEFGQLHPNVQEQVAAAMRQAEEALGRKLGPMEKSRSFLKPVQKLQDKISPNVTPLVTALKLTISKGIAAQIHVAGADEKPKPNYSWHRFAASVMESEIGKDRQHTIRDSRKAHVSYDVESWYEDGLSKCAAQNRAAARAGAAKSNKALKNLELMLDPKRLADLTKLMRSQGVADAQQRAEACVMAAFKHAQTWIQADFPSQRTRDFLPGWSWPKDLPKQAPIVRRNGAA